MANSGANLAILDVLEDNLAETRKICEGYEVKVQTYSCDVTDVSRVRAVFKDINSTLGPVE